uniref:GntR family transcriptional regulator n=1 Tax=Methylobacterium sp. B34 TaxID=95563 RepID=UPI001FCC87FA
MNKIEPGIGISRRYLHDEVAERMRELIRSGEMEPKARINESELTERFGISRTPLREAIKILATEGLLELLPNRGARVASISDGELEEMMEVIAGLEATAGDLACRTITDADIDALVVDHDAMVEAWKSGDEAGYFSHNRRIHEGIMAASRNLARAVVDGVGETLEAHQGPRLRGADPRRQVRGARELEGRAKRLRQGGHRPRVVQAGEDQGR